MRIFFTLFLCVLLAALQPVVKGDNAIIEWLYTEKKGIYINNIAQYFIRRNDSIEIYTNEKIVTNCKIFEEINEIKDAEKAFKENNSKSYESNEEAISINEDPSIDTDESAYETITETVEDNVDINIKTIESLYNSENEMNMDNDNYGDNTSNNEYIESPTEKTSVDEQEVFTNSNVTYEDASGPFKKEKKFIKKTKENERVLVSYVKYTTDKDILNELFKILNEYPRIVTLKNINDLSELKYVHGTFNKLNINNFRSKENEIEPNSETNKNSFNSNYQVFLNDVIEEIAQVYLTKKDIRCVENGENKKYQQQNFIMPTSQIYVEINDNAPLKSNAEKLNYLSKLLLNESNEGAVKENIEKNTEEQIDKAASVTPAFLRIESSRTPKLKSMANVKGNTGVKKIVNGNKKNNGTKKNNGNKKNNANKKNNGNKKNNDNDDDNDIDSDTVDDDGSDNDSDNENDNENDNDDGNDNDNDNDNDDDDDNDIDSDTVDDDENENDDDNDNDNDDVDFNDDKEDDEEDDEDDLAEINRVTKFNNNKKMKLKMNIDQIQKKYGNDFLDESTGKKKLTLDQLEVIEKLTDEVKNEKPNKNGTLLEEADKDGGDINEKETNENIIARKERKIKDFQSYEKKTLDDIRKQKKNINEMINNDLDQLLKPAQKEYLRLARVTRNKLFNEYQEMLKDEIKES